MSLQREQRASPPGRRRDPSIRPRALSAALDLYARDGWHGFTFDNVAKEAGVGKPALYRRWENPAQLLVEAFEMLRLPTAKDCGSLEADLRHFAEEFIDFVTEPRNFMIANRLGLDRSINDELAAAYDTTVYLPRVEAVRALTSRAKMRGELGERDSSLMAVEIVLGALNVRQSFSPRSDPEKTRRMLTRYIHEVIDVLLAGLHVRAVR